MIIRTDPFVWNVIIRGLTDEGLFREAVDYYYRMQFEGVRADSFTFPFVIKACGGLSSLMEGGKVHAKVTKIGLDVDVYVCNALIVMYAKLGLIECSEKVFEEMNVKDLVSWNSMISGYVSAGDGFSALTHFRKMLALGMRYDRFSIISGLGACSFENFLRSGKEIHCQIIRSGLGSDPMILTSLIDMYGKCGQVDYSESVFYRISGRNVIHVNAMIGAYVLNSKYNESLSCLEKMIRNDNIVPDTITLINLLPSCSKLGELKLGKSIHALAIRKGYCPHLVLETTLIDMYGSCQRVKEANLMFIRMKDRNLISWNAMISAYVQNGHGRVAFELFHDLLNEPFVPDEMTITSILPAYAEFALPKEGKQIHGYMTKLGLNSNSFVCNSLIYMYAKCGDLQGAKKTFDLKSSQRDIVSWNTLIMGYAIHGLGSISLRLFSRMLEEGVIPNGSTFVSLLLACSIAGLVEESWTFFNSMKKKYGIDPGIEHYGCIIDLLGRVGSLDQAKHLIDEMPLEPTARIWGSLLAASRHHRNIELAELAVHKISSLQHENTGSYVLLSNMYAEAGRWEDVERINYLMKKQGLERNVGWTRIESKGETCQFTNYDQSHAKIAIIYDALDIILRKIREVSNVDVSRFKPKDRRRQRENHPMFHSVRLAICFGLISSSVGNSILVRKNIRMCEDCHKAVKKISEITNREIVVGDTKIYHHFHNGHCSCGDYW
ncbi:hypothetical protein Leryth_009238 [Lithospermum erythrorhizon]|nr:hypothetical protein Leryth_009238 [Lithospermum erythrorhizon]